MAETKKGESPASSSRAMGRGSSIEASIPRCTRLLAAALDTDAETRRAAEVALAAAQLRRKQAEDAQLLAAQRVAEAQAAQAANEAQAAASKPEEPAQPAQPQQQARANGNQQRR